jgi:hypothetical protein
MDMVGNLKIMTRFFITPVIFALGIGIGTLFGQAKPPAKVFGNYVGIGCSGKAGTKDCLPTSARDRVQILRGRGNQSSVKIRIVFAGGHVCSLEGRAVRTGNSFTVRADGLDPQKPCRLALRIRGSVLTLEDAGGLCREVYCGTRGAFHGARFKKKP